MDILLCTIGFAGKTAEEFFTLLTNAEVHTVIDIRLNRVGQLSGFAKHPDLAYFLERVARLSYKHEPLLAPTEVLLRTYRATKDWPAYEAGFRGLMESREIPRSLDTSAWPARIALLCSEPGPEKCHRRIVADLLAAHWTSRSHNVEIRHLVAARPGKSKLGRKKRSAAP